MRTKNWKILRFFLVLFICSIFWICLNSMLETYKICFAWYECNENGFCYETPIATPVGASSFYHGFSYSATTLMPQESLNIWELSSMSFADVIGYYNTGTDGVAGMANSSNIMRPTASMLTLFNSELLYPGVVVTDGFTAGYEPTTYPPVTMFTLTGFPIPDVASDTEYERIYPPRFFTGIIRWEELYPANNYLWWH